VPGDEIASRIHIGKYKGLDEPPYLQDIMLQCVAYAGADAIIAMSPVEATRIAGFVNDRSRIHICIRGVDLAHFAGSARSFEQVKRVLFVGRNSLEKGSDILEDVAGLLAARRPDIRIVAAGDFEPGTRNNIEYIGYVGTADLPRLFMSSDILLSCSRTEGYPQVVAEALAMGTPVVMPRHLLGDLYGEAKGVVGCDLSAESLAVEVGRLADDPARASQLSQSAIAYASAHLNCANWRKAYRNILLDAQPSVPTL
jgi:glycosyltransferase involved in cell wall biosynthesis